MHISPLGRPVFVLRSAYDDILDETARILDAYQNAVVVIENCFDLNRARLSGIARQFDKSDAVLILSSRNIAAEAEAGNQTILDRFETFRHYRLEEMDEGEATSFVEITDQIAAWSEFNALTRSSRLRFITRTCEGSLPGFLLRLLRSNHVRERYSEEYRKTENLHPTETRAAIAALYVGGLCRKVPKRPPPRQVDIVKPTYQPSKAELNEDVRVNATFEEAVDALTRPVEINYVPRPPRRG